MSLVRKHPLIVLGGRVILAEYAIGVVVPLALGLISIRVGLSGPDGFSWLAVSPGDLAGKPPPPEGQIAPDYLMRA